MKVIVKYDEELLKKVEAIRMEEIKDLEDQLEEVGKALKDAVEVILQQKADLEIAKEIVERYEAYFANKEKPEVLQ